MKSDFRRPLSEGPLEITSGCNSITGRHRRKQRHNFKNGVRCFYTESEFDSSSVSLSQQAFTPLMVRLLHHLTIYKIHSEDTSCSKATSVKSKYITGNSITCTQNSLVISMSCLSFSKDLNILESGIRWWGWGRGRGMGERVLLLRS